MEILESIDIEDVVREALQPYTTAKVYCHKLPQELEMPCVRVSSVSGTRSNQIDAHQITIQYRAYDEAEAEQLANRLNAVLQAVAKEGTTPMRNAQIVTHGNWGADPARPDISMRQSSFMVTAHGVTKEV